MKKQLFLMSMAVLAIASCSKDQTISTNTGREIDFRTSLATRATETTTANINEFYVTAIDKNNANYFENQKFSKSGTTFTSDPKYYWPSDGSTIDFYAYSPSAENLGGTLTINNTTKTLTGFSPAAAIADQKDFITVHATGSKENEGTGVALAFDHRLAQIEIKAKNTNTGYVYKVAGVRIGKPVSKGSFDFGTNAWTLDADKANYEVTYDAAKDIVAAPKSLMEAENNNAMLLPQQLVAWDPATDKQNTSNGAYLALKIQITTASGARVYPAKGDYDWAAVAINTNWKAGFKYVYTLDFSNGAGKVDPEKPTPTDPTDPFKPGEDILGSAIVFTVTVNTWNDGTQPDINM